MRRLCLLAASMILISACTDAAPTLLSNLIPITGGDGQGGENAGELSSSENMPRGATLRYGDTVHGETTRNGCQLWSFSGGAGEEVSISLMSEDFDTFLALFGPQDKFIASNDDGGAGDASLIDTLVLPTTGDYTIAVQGYSGSDFGFYDLNLARSAQGLTYAERGGGQLDYGDTIYSDLLDWRLSLIHI